MSWLTNHLSTKANIKQVVERLTEIGLEVENVKSPDSDMDNFVTCKVIKSQKHPNADKMKICDVEIGDSIFLSCGLEKETVKLLSLARDKIARDLNIIDDSKFKINKILSNLNSKITSPNKIRYIIKNKSVLITATHAIHKILPKLVKLNPKKIINNHFII